MREAEAVSSGLTRSVYLAMQRGHAAYQASAFGKGFGKGSQAKQMQFSLRKQNQAYTASPAAMTPLSVLYS